MDNREKSKIYEMPNLEKLQKMREIDIREVDKNSLVDIQDVKIHTELSDRERMVDFIKQIGNPYCYVCNGIVVKIKFAGKKSLEECLKATMFAND
jgi:hypothetical protein